MSDVDILVGRDQMAEFDALTRLKLGECYGALRGPAGSRAGSLAWARCPRPSWRP